MLTQYGGKKQLTTGYRKQPKTQHTKNRPSCAGLPFHQKLYSLRKNRIYPSTLGFSKVSDDVIRKRLSARGWDEKLIQNNINWYYLELVSSHIIGF